MNIIIKLILIDKNKISFGKIYMYKCIYIYVYVDIQFYGCLRL